ncbi:MAG: hypothetical protein LUE14_05330 [Clostridiales bacterium]|nr:hypothetical protein [Clostridiales bacterium]
MTGTAVRYLLLVDNDGNHNKYYRMVQENDATFRAEYGRVGAKPMLRPYPMSLWDKKYNEKIRKGYVDKTNLYETEAVDSGFAPISDAKTNRLVDALLMAARKYVKKHYTFSCTTQEAIGTARRYISRLSESIRVEEANRLLLELFATIPRRMPNVKDYLAADMSDLPKILERENGLVDAMEGQVVTGTKETAGDGNKTILQAHGLSITPCTAAENDKLKKMLGRDSYKFRQAFCVSNEKTEERYEAWCKKNGATDTDRHLYFHGSITPNYWNILSLGLDPAKAARGMFGYGTYFANKARKSIRYTSLRGTASIRGSLDSGYLALFEVAYKSPMQVYKWEAKHSSLRLKDVAAKNCDAVFAHKGADLVNDEIIVYRKDQMTVRYIIEIANN